MANIVARSALILRPKAPLEEWLRSLPQAEAGPLPPFKGEPYMFLVPDMDSREEMMSWLEENYDFFFEDILGNWWTDPGVFPAGRSYEMFRTWFDVEVLPLVEDACEPDGEDEL